jgi:hypothetical protein
VAFTFGFGMGGRLFARCVVADLQAGAFAFRGCRIASLKTGQYNGGQRGDYQPKGWPLQNRTTGKHAFRCSFTWRVARVPVFGTRVLGFPFFLFAS